MFAGLLSRVPGQATAESESLYFRLSRRQTDINRPHVAFKDYLDNVRMLESRPASVL